MHRDLLQSQTTPLEHRLQNASTSKDGHHHRSGCIEQERPGPQSGSNVKLYKDDPKCQRAAQLKGRFKRIFSRKTDFVSLPRLLDRMDELLRVLARPEIPLHTNRSENCIRCHATKHKISKGIRSDASRDARDIFLRLTKTCQKLRVSFFDYLGHRLDVNRAQQAPPLQELVSVAKI